MRNRVFQAIIFILLTGSITIIDDLALSAQTVNVEKEAGPLSNEAAKHELKQEKDSLETGPIKLKNINARLEDLNLQLETKVEELYAKVQESARLIKSLLQELSNTLKGKRLGTHLEANLIKLEDLHLQLETKVEELYAKMQESTKLRRELNNIQRGIMREPLSASADLEARLAKLKDLNVQLETKAKELHIKVQEAGQMKRDFEGLKKAVETLNKERLSLKEENKNLQNEIVRLKENHKNEKAMFYQELGTVYTQLKLFDLGIEAYKNCLNLNPSNAQVHYNLGLLYKHSKNYNKESIYHLKKYLLLNPRAENKKEVEYLIKMISAD